MCQKGSIKALKLNGLNLISIHASDNCNIFRKKPCENSEYNIDFLGISSIEIVPAPLNLKICDLSK